MNFGNTPPVKILNKRFEDRQSRLKRNSQLLYSPILNTSITPLNKKIRIEYENQINEYDFSLNLYTIPPFGQIELEDSQRAVEERLKVLCVFDDMKADQAKPEFNRFEELATRFKPLGDVFVNELSGGKENTRVQAARRKDHISHFLLRLFFCQNEANKKWFIAKEVELLRYRLESEKSTLDLVKLLTYNNLNFLEVESKEKKILIKQNKINYNNAKTSPSSIFYKLPFEEALELVKNRRVFLQDGYCFCSANEMFTIICSKFKLELSRALANLFNYFPQLDENYRLLPIIEATYANTIKSKKAAKLAEYESNQEHIAPEMIDELAVTSFPPCMRNIHELLRQNHHLKHYGRLHYGLFLKGIGLRLDDALSFFREEFIQNMTPEKFAKEHSYNIRYNYGKEGKRVNLSAFSCSKILNGNQPGTGDSHGCPFKHFDTNNLTKLLKKHNIDDENLREMIELTSQQKYTTACSNYFACKNKNVKPGAEMIHPNLYFRESRKIANSVFAIEENNENNEVNNEDAAQENQLQDINFDESMDV